MLRSINSKLNNGFFDSIIKNGLEFDYDYEIDSKNQVCELQLASAY